MVGVCQRGGREILKPPPKSPPQCECFFLQEHTKMCPKVPVQCDACGKEMLRERVSVILAVHAVVHVSKCFIPNSSH